MPMPLDAWQQRLEGHFAELAAKRSALGQPLFALEHGLAVEELDEIFVQLRLRPARGSVLRPHWLLWVIYATECGYGYAGDEYWPSFEGDIPGWPTNHRLPPGQQPERMKGRYSCGAKALPVTLCYRSLQGEPHLQGTAKFPSFFPPP